MRLSTLPPLVVALALIFGAAFQYPDGAGLALGAVGFLVTGVWLTLEIASQVIERAERVRTGKLSARRQQTDDA